MLLTWLAWVAGLAACGGGDSPMNDPDASGDAVQPINCPALPADTGAPESFTATVRVVDEQGAPVAGAAVELGDTTLTSNECGEAAVENRSDAVLAVIRKDGFLAEPVIMGFSDRGQVVEVQVLSDKDGARWVMHSGGDVMLSRRYEDNPYGPPLLPAGDLAGGARYVVAPIARAFALGDLNTANVETVVSNLPESAGYPAKTVVINTKPETLAGLEELGVNLAVLGNNHIRDYFETGVTQTMAALDAVGIPYVGASDGSEPGNRPRIVDIRGVRVATLSWGLLDGDSSNNEYAVDGDPVPADLDPADAWEYEARSWGFSGATWSVPVASRRAGSAWRLFRDAEAGLGDTEAAEAWASLYAVYPELQDWVERRGHGGAARWQTSQAMEDIAALAGVVDVVAVQFHGSAEFEDAPSAVVLGYARAAIDAGAHIAIIHHPHVLQGVEWYKGRLIVHSLGNFLFDQHYEITTPTAMLRTVWEGAELIQARMIPIDLGNYRPNPVADGMARRHARLLWEKSASGAYSDRHSAGGGNVSFLAPPPADTQLGQVRVRNHDMIFSPSAPATQTVRVDVAAGAQVALEIDGLIHGRAGGASVLLGRELYGWGGLEDELADGEAMRDLHWRVIHSDTQVVTGDDAASGRGYVTMRRLSTFATEAWVATFARIALPEHRYYHDDGGTSVAADGEATYTIQLAARADCQAAPYIRLDQYTRDEARPSSKLGEYVIDFAVQGDGQWHTVDIAVPAAALTVGSRRVGAFKPQIRLPPPAEGECNLAIDDLRVIEWRPAADMPDLFGPYDYVRNPGASDVSVDLTVMPLRD